MITKHTKTCVLCPTKIPHNNKLCEPCYKAYKQFITANWFVELEYMQKHQDALDRKEIESLDHDNYFNDTSTLEKKQQLPLKRSVGRPLTHWIIEQQVLNIFDTALEEGKRLSLRKIATKLNNKIKYFTVRRILLQYRKDQFLSKKV